MVPHVAQRGSSFKGAAAYYLHDKKANTNERVAWTYTHNLPTMSAYKGFGYMASTAMQAEVLKHRSGGSKAGKKSHKKPVYSFSLSWHPEQSPDQSTMQRAAMHVLEKLGLADHEAVFVAHNDEPHSHVHVIANLVHPETGKTASMSYDQLTMSTWAEEFERKDGKIYCEQRVENNKERRENANDNRQLKMVKHREKRLERATLIQSLYKQADNTKAFQAALEHNGYTLAMGHKGRVVLVDREGSIFALARQLEGQRAKDIRERLDNLNALPEAQPIADNRKHFMRDDYETKRQKLIVDAAIEKEEQTKEILRQSFKKQNSQKSVFHYDFKQHSQDKKVQAPKEPKTTQKQIHKVTKSYADEMDETLAKERAEIRKKLIKEEKVRAYYNRESYTKQLDDLKQQRSNAILPNRKKQLTQQIVNTEKSLTNVDQRMSEQGINPHYIFTNETKTQDQTPKTTTNTNDKNYDLNKTETNLTAKIEFNNATVNKKQLLREQIKNRSKNIQYANRSI